MTKGSIRDSEVNEHGFTKREKSPRPVYLLSLEKQAGCCFLIVRIGGYYTMRIAKMGAHLLMDIKSLTRRSPRTQRFNYQEEG